MTSSKPMSDITVKQVADLMIYPEDTFTVHGDGTGTLIFQNAEPSDLVWFDIPDMLTRLQALQQQGVHESRRKHFTTMNLRIIEAMKKWTHSPSIGAISELSSAASALLGFQNIGALKGRSNGK